MNSAATRVERTLLRFNLGRKRGARYSRESFHRPISCRGSLPSPERTRAASQLYRSDRISIESRPWKSLDRGIALYNFCSRISTPAIILPSIRFKLQAAHFFSKGNDSHPFRRDETNDLDREDSIIGQLR